ncbi:MAG: ABC transporter permease [Anaerolineaceae bacterium]|nr:ABC transporter permease [Anaerolineaceae bacterium]MBN2677870.1 ABC transporter permease [Anaerolineaceae bacterium]
MKFKIVKVPATIWMRVLIPVLSILVTFIITSILILIAGGNPLEAYYYFLIAPLSDRVSALEVLVKATPLLLTGACAIFAFTAGYWNIGGEGQFLAGAFAATGAGIMLVDVPPAVSIPVMILVSFLAGALWALIPAWLKAKLAVDEVVTTLLFNSIILFIIAYTLNNFWRNPLTGWPQSPEISETAHFLRLIPRSRLHMGFLVALVVIVIEWFVLARTSLGLKMRALGMGKTAARFAGINVNGTLFIAALVSGGFAGLAGGGDIAGIHFHLIEAVASGLGYSGIIVAMFAALNPLAVIPSALFIGLIDTGAQGVSRALGLPTYLGDTVQTTLLLVTLAMFVLVNYRIKKV